MQMRIPLTLSCLLAVLQCSFFSPGMPGRAVAGPLTEHQSNTHKSSVDMRERVLASGGAYLALDADGVLFGWGYTLNGVLGPIPEKFQMEPMPIEGLPVLQKVAINPCVGAGIDLDGQVWVWGLNNYGTVDPSFPPELTILPPQIMEGLPPAKRVFVWNTSIIVLGEDGSMWGWGKSLPGHPSMTLQYPSLLDEAFTDAPAIERVAYASSTNYGGAYALDEAGQLWHWPYDGDILTPDARAPFPGVPPLTAVDASSNIALALDTSGQVWSWSHASSNIGCDVIGRTAEDTSIPAPIPGLTGIVRLSTSYLNVTAQNSAGQLWGWGCNDDGGLGTGDLTSPKGTPIRLPHLDNTPFITLDGSTGLSADTDGQLLYWGSNWFGAQADGTTSLWQWVSIDQDPTVTPGSPAPTTLLGSSAESTHILDAAGHLWGSGRNRYGELGDGTFTARDTWTPIQHTQTFVQVITALTATAALDTSGQVWTWGYNNVGQLGEPAGAARPTPLRMPSFASVKKLSRLRDGFLALDVNGQVWTWGYNLCFPNSHIPQRIDLGAAGSAVDISSMSSHLLLKDNAGKVWSMGYNDYFQLGVPGQFPRCSPVQVRGLPSIALIEAGSSVSMVLDTAGRVWAWGNNAWGELGTGAPSSPRWQPGRVQGLPVIQQLHTGDRFVVALDVDGRGWFWGLNEGFAFAEPVWDDISTPTLLVVSKPIKTFLAGEHIYFRHTDGTLGASGLNEYGALGIGNAWTPTEVDSTIWMGDGEE